MRMACKSFYIICCNIVDNYLTLGLCEKFQGIFKNSYSPQNCSQMRMSRELLNSQYHNTPAPTLFRISLAHHQEARNMLIWCDVALKRE